MDETITSNLILDYQKDNSTLYYISNNNNITNNSNNNSSGNNNINIEYENNSLLGEEFAKLYEAPAEVIAILSLFYGGISIIAIIGNTLVIWIVATTRQMRTVTNLYIANLAFSDVIIGMFCIPFQFQAALLQRWNLPEFMCAFCPFVQVLSVNVSVFTLTAIAIDRHRAIINPLRARPTRFISKVIIITIWIAATAFSIPCAIAFRVIQITEIYRENGVIKNVTRPFCENVNLTEDQLKSYRYYLVFVQYVVPLCVISFIYIQMAIKLWGSRTPGNAQDSRDITLLRNKKKVIKMLIIVVVVFGVCWLPLQTYNILYVTLPYINEYRFINIIWFCCDWLAMSNSCYNPFIYGIYNEKFKREFNKRFSLCFCNFDGRDTPDRSFSVYTRASSIRSNYTTNQNPNNYNNYYNRTASTRCNSNNSNNNNRNNILNQQHQQQQQQQKRITLLKTTSADTYCNGNDKNDSNESIMNNSKQSMTTINNNNCANKSVLLLEQKHKLKCKHKHQQKQKYFSDDLNTRTTNLEYDDKMINNNPLCTSIIPSEDMNNIPIEENIKEKHSQTPVNDFYKNSTILITGGTGFLGKVLIQKLLTSFDIRKIYLLIRLKNDMSLNERIENFFNESIFKYIHENKPELFNKIHPIQVNYNANDLDILPYERDLLIDEVQIVFNVVASVKFNEKLSDAIYINVLGTKKILDLVLKMNNLKSFLHVSTLYTNCNRNHVDEAVYDVDIGYEKIIRIYHILNNEHFEKLSHCLIGEMPNTYTMTKKCSENLVNHLTYNLPAGIFRAPIIMSTYKEPFPGWTDNLYGPSGLCTWSAKGFVHCLYGDANKKANLVPVDYCVNAMISCAWDIFRRYKIRIYEQTEIPVYNYIFDNNNLTWGQFMRMARKGFHEPFDKTIWYFAYFIIPSKPLHRLTTFLVHNIPGHILDLIAATTGQKKIFSKGYKKISKVIDMMSYFGLREWKFTNRNIIELDKRLKSTNEKNLLEFNIESIDWNEFFKNYLSGIRKYVMKETNDRIAEKRKIFMRLYILHLIMKSSAIFIIFLNVWKLFKKIMKRFMPILCI